MDNLDEITAGMPLRKGDPCVIKNGHAYAASEGEDPTCVCKVDCTTNATGVLAPIGEQD